jgi:WD40 repeat protein
LEHDPRLLAHNIGDVNAAVAVSKVAFSPDGNWLVVGATNGIYLWDMTEEGSPPVELTAKTEYPGSVKDLAFSADSTILAVVGGDSELRLWNLARPQADPTILKYSNDAELTAVIFRRDGTSVVTGDVDGNIRTWLLTSELADSVCQLVRRNLSPKEWHDFVGEAVDYRPTCPNLPPGNTVGIGESAAEIRAKASK